MQIVAAATDRQSGGTRTGEPEVALPVAPPQPEVEMDGAEEDVKARPEGVEKLHERGHAGSLSGESGGDGNRRCRTM